MTYSTSSQLIDPRLMLEKAQILPGMHIADFGCGRTGHVVFPAAKLVGDRGVVYAVDILKDVLESIKKRAQAGGCTNIHEVWADMERAGSVRIPGGTLDMVFMINVLFHCADYSPALREAMRLLKEKGRVVAVDWIKPLANMPPKGTFMVDFDKLTTEARAMGFALQDDFEIGAYHRAVILYRH